MARVYTRVNTWVYTTSVHKSSKLDTKKVIAMTDCHKAKQEQYFGGYYKGSKRRVRDSFDCGRICHLIRATTSDVLLLWAASQLNI